MLSSGGRRVRLITSAPAHPGAVLMVYGLGGADRYGVGMAHVARGGTLLAWDLGYWERKGAREHRKLRLSVNGLHPPAYVMLGPAPDDSRLRASGQGVAKFPGGRADGPVLLIGNGPKSNAVGAEGWAAAKSLELRQMFPDRKIVYRPKPGRPAEAGVVCDEVDGGPVIEEVLSRVSLVVCRHSNVAIDACKAGVPVVCEDGAAAAIYPRHLADWEQQPGLKLRREFLCRLAWWQWSIREAEQGLPWGWLNGLLEILEQPFPEAVAG